MFIEKFDKFSNCPTIFSKITKIEMTEKIQKFHTVNEQR